MTDYVSPYLQRPRRSLEQARMDVRGRIDNGVVIITDCFVPPDLPAPRRIHPFIWLAAIAMACGALIALNQLT